MESLDGGDGRSVGTDITSPAIAEESNSNMLQTIEFYTSI